MNYIGTFLYIICDETQAIIIIIKKKQTVSDCRPYGDIS